MESGWALVAHPCYPSYRGARDQEDCQPLANSSRDPISIKSITNKVLAEWLRW
jgi:hypothetical protein